MRPISTAERAIGIERKRSMTPRSQVLGQADRGLRGPERHRLDEDARQQEVDVADTPRGSEPPIAPPNT